VIGLDKNTLILAGVGAAVLGVLVLMAKKPGQGFVQSVGSTVGSAVVDLTDGVVSGVAETIGDKIGVPRTDKTACQLALEQGRTWDASFACPAGTFIGSFF